MQVSIGTSTAAQAFQAGVQAVTHALQQLSSSQVPRLALAFCNSEVDAHGFYAGLRQHLGEWVPIVGGSAMGMAHAQQTVTHGPCAAVVLMTGDDWEWQLATSHEIYRDPLLAGEVLAGQLPSLDNGRCLLMFYDSVRFAATATQPPVLIPSGPLIAGAHHQRLRTLPLFGAGVLGDGQFNLTWQFTGDAVSRHSASVLQFAGDFQVFSCIMHGCVPMTEKRYTVTDVFGQYLYSLDNQPIVALLDQLTGDSSWRYLQLDPAGGPLPVTKISIARPLSEDPDEQQLVTRLLSGVLPGDEAVVLFEPDFVKGQQVMLMQRDPQLMVQSAYDNTVRLLADLKAAGQVGRFAIYFDCGGRMSVISGSDTEEASVVRDLVTAAGIPFLALYTGVEIAPLQGGSYGLDWSGVLVIFSQPA